MSWLSVTDRASAEAIHERMTHPGRQVPTGVPTIDKSIYLWGDRRGIPPGTYVLVGGASNFGKTLMAMHLLKQAARSGQPAAMVSLDMKNLDAIARMQQSMVTDIDFRDWLPSRWDKDNVYTLATGLKEWRMKHKGGDIWIHEDRSRELVAVADRVRSAAEASARFIVIDHLQKVRVSHLRGDVYATSDLVSETLDDLVDELGVTIVGLSQLNRRASSETERKPTMFDLHGGTSMESNAGIVLMLDHSRYEMDMQRPYLIRSYVILAKNQIGPKNLEVPVLWNTSEGSCTEAMPDEVHEWPSFDRR